MSTTYGMYLVCHEHLPAVKDFLGQVFSFVDDGFAREGWQTCYAPGSPIKINLMSGKTLALTQHMTFELYLPSLAALRALASEHKQDISVIRVTDIEPAYDYHYFTLPGPADICAIECSFCRK